MGEQERRILADFTAAAAVGSPDTVRHGMADFIERTGANELMLVAQIFDHSARLRSFEIAKEVAQAI